MSELSVWAVAYAVMAAVWVGGIFGVWLSSDLAGDRAGCAVLVLACATAPVWPLAFVALGTSAVVFWLFSRKKQAQR